MSKKPTIKDMEQQVSELTEALQRERADADNMRRRHETDYAAMRNVVKTQVVEELLPVIDNFELSLKHVPAELEGNNFVKGVEHLVKQFDKTLSEMGVERIKTVGEAFDPNLHEAVESEGEGEKEVVTEEVRAGYKVGEVVIRHATVKVKKGK